MHAQGVGTAQDIDNGMKLGTNQPMGPLQLADFIGLTQNHMPFTKRHVSPICLLQNCVVFLLRNCW